MNKSNFKYCLRYAVEPGFHVGKRLDALVQFCTNALIDDVMFFINCEELNRGHLTFEETALWIDVIKEGKERLNSLGVTVSINPWSTILHSDRGRTLKECQKFNLLTDPYGNTATAQACPLCNEWRKYITEMYAYYATLKPDTIWVEDDFRFHNHPPLIWGGCFCDIHMAEYSRRAGEKLTRNEFVDGILRPGTPHPYRKIWLDTACETMVDIANKIGESVHKVSPLTKVGLMSSIPEVHCAEGRDWKGILKGFAGELKMVNRPHLPNYTETTSQQYLVDFSLVSRMSCAMIPENTLIYPELENFQDTRFTKSKSFTRFQIHTSQILGADGITLNIFDMMGNGIIMEEGYQDVLKEEKEFLNYVKSLGLEIKSQIGIKIPVSPKSSYSLHTYEGCRMEELYPRENIWCGLLSAFGIANTYSLETRHHNSILAISGQYFRNLNEKQLIELFDNNFLILDGDAVHTLFDMGYGYLAGIRNIKWYLKNTGFQSFEQVCDGKRYCGLDEARLSCQGAAGDYLSIEYIKDPSIKTLMKNPSGEIIGWGMAVNKNVCILPYGNFEHGFFTHLNSIRQSIFHEIIKEIQLRKHPIFIENAPYIATYEYELKYGRVIALFNASRDDYSLIRIYFPGRNVNEIKVINSIEKQTNLANFNLIDGYLELNEGIRSMEFKILILN